MDFFVDFQTTGLKFQKSLSVVLISNDDMIKKLGPTRTPHQSLAAMTKKIVSFRPTGMKTATMRSSPSYNF